MIATKSRVAELRGRQFSIKWGMNALLLFCEYAEFDTIDDGEIAISTALIEAKSVTEETGFTGMKVDTIKILAKACRAAINGGLPENIILDAIGTGEADKLVTYTVEAFLEQLPNYDAGITESAPEDKPKKKRKRDCLKFWKWLRAWVGGRTI